MRLLLGSGGLSTDERRQRWMDAFDTFLGDITSFVFVPFALADHDGYVEKMHSYGFDGGREIRSLHTDDDPLAAIEAAEAIYVGGGNSFRLLRHMQQGGLLDPIRRRIEAGIPYIGISAGSNFACPTIKTTNDMPIVAPDGLDALRLIPFQINPHYFSGRTWIRHDETSFTAYGGETRDVRITEFLEENDVPVLGVWEGGWIRIEDGQSVLEGSAARLFRRGQEPLDLTEGTLLDDLIAGAPNPT